MAQPKETTCTTPLFQWQQIHCKKCKWNCNPSTEAYQKCILTHIALNLEQLRITIQTRTQHLSW